MVVAKLSADDGCKHMRNVASKPGYVAHNSYQFEVLKMPLPEPFVPRQTEAGQPTVGELLLPETMVNTNCNSGPHIVFAVTRYALSGRSPALDGLFAWSIVCMYPDDVEKDRSIDYLRSTNRLSYLNEYVAFYGRILHVFPNNDDEVFLIDHPDFLRDRKTG